MGKKVKITGDAPPAEALQAPLGVRTRAQTLALLQNLHLRSRTVYKLDTPAATHAHASKLPPTPFNYAHALSPSSTGEASFGENSFDFDLHQRGTLESTPCSLVRDFDSNGLAVRSTSSGAAYENSVQRSNPFTHEMEQIFVGSEMQQQQHFIDKYNYDIVNDLPLSGRYDWVRVDF